MSVGWVFRVLSQPTGTGVRQPFHAMLRAYSIRATRLTATLLHELQRESKRYGVVSMCVGSGMGAAAVFEAENGKKK